ncbi:MAG: 50S ribosomal protein L24 [Methylococcaceae bacterium]|nr:50S ribosomal protein L24 [Methylococcaceae bacterium]MCI0668131.1 50S ribosomal protein L24 [Methylococcaceae bacterium]MCI0733160.1 50S ribosomal protein L24 [Methylococcaceae bacterium]
MERIRKGDDVMVLTGKDKGKKGSVQKFVQGGKVIVQGVNLVKKHRKPNPNRGMPGGIEEKEMPIHLSNVGIFNPETKKADRVGFRTLEDGRKVRYFKSTKEIIDI